MTNFGLDRLGPVKLLPSDPEIVAAMFTGLLDAHTKKDRNPHPPHLMDHAFYDSHLRLLKNYDKPEKLTGYLINTQP